MDSTILFPVEILATKGALLYYIGVSFLVAIGSMLLSNRRKEVR